MIVAGGARKPRVRCCTGSRMQQERYGYLRCTAEGGGMIQQSYQVVMDSTRVHLVGLKSHKNRQKILKSFLLGREKQ